MKFFLMLIFLTSLSFTQIYEDVVELNDGSIIKGVIIETKPDEYIKIKSGDNIFVYQMDQINIIRKEEIEGYLFDDPHKSRYFFAPTATPIGPGNNYIRNTWLFVNSLGVSFGENVSTEIGFSVFPGGSLDDQFKQLSYKYSTDKTYGNWQSSFGFLYLGQFEFGGGFIFGSFTKGDDDNNVSITPGLAYFQDSDEGLKFAENLTLVYSGKKRVSNSLSLISENWFFYGEDAFLISNSGLRFFGRQLSVDFSWPFSISSNGSAFGFPLLSFSYTF